MNNIKENIVLAFFVGLFLGAISIFLAIATVFFSQITKIISIVASAQYQMFDMKMIPMLIIASIIGGYIGTVWNQKISSAKLENLYTVFMIAITAITGFNVIHFI